ncbi:MAG TPA: AAA domain-containing protein [Flavisolibacter sp.]|jgi:predicted DNA-binding WGR domain protein/DNA polymerase III delta prime subunit|nr:AAA domain-containing protein [Flavisolibacter sp.]
MHTTFQQYLQSAFLSGPWSTDEVIEFVLPLFEEVLSFHENNEVGSFEKPDTVFLTNGRLDIDEAHTHAPALQLAAVQALLDHQRIQGYTITEKILLDEDINQNKATIVNLQIHTRRDEPFQHPVYLPGYLCYEMKVGHHDAQTDIFCLGLILGSVVMGLDLYDEADLNQFAVYRNQPAGLNPRMHPTLCALVTEMTELDRSRRSRDLAEIVQRLKHYRDYDPQREIDLSAVAAFQIKKPTERKGFILSKLRNRLFDTSRRNRLLYYKPNTRFVNLTVSSVPMVLHYQSINPQLLFTWNEEISKLIVSQRDLSLNKYLRFEDHPYLNSQLNSIRQTSENDKKEYGFSQLKLVVAFLHWHNLKEDVNERIQSPLLLLPVELERKKSLKEERFTLKIIDNAAIINPVLSNYLKELYGIVLPESIDFDDTSMEQFYQYLQAQIDAAKQGVKLNYIDKPRIKIVHSIARQTINNYRKRLKQKGTPAFHQVDYSYSEENYKPLGLELFRQKIAPRQSTLEFLLGDAFAPAPSNFAANGDAVKSTFQLTEGDSNPYSWDFDICNVVLGNFNYKKMSLVSDYNKAIDNGVEHPVFNQLFSSQAKEQAPETVVNNPAEWYHVITADPTQAKAVLHSRTGKSYIIQGPPGTGKSQTITNLIADFLAQGKSVLFVCEKRAALDVVYHRLQQNQLAELCCYIHDSQGDKKEFIKDLRMIYDDFLKNKMDLPSITAQRKIVLEQLLLQIDILQQYHHLQRSVNDGAGVRTRHLMETIIKLKAHIPKPDMLTGTPIPSYQRWVEFGEAIQQLGKSLEETGAEPALAQHPFRNLGVAVVSSDNPFGLMDSLVSHSHHSIQQLSDIIAQHNIPLQHAEKLAHIKNLIEDSVVLEPLAQSKNLKLVDISNEEAKAFENAFKAYKKVQQSYEDMLANNKRWLKKFERQEVEQALALAQKHEKSFFSFFNGSWRRLKKQLKESYDFASHAVKPDYSAILTQLQEEYQEQERLNRTKAELQEHYRIQNPEETYIGIESLRGKQGDKEIDFLLQHPQANEVVLQLSKLNNSLHQLELQLKQCLYGYDEKSLSQIKDEITTIYHNADTLKDLLPSLRRFCVLPQDIQNLIRKLPLTPLQAEAAMAHKTLEAMYERHHTFSTINYNVLRSCVNDIEKCYKELLRLNSAYIRAERRHRFLQHYEMSNTAASVLPPEQRQLKKDYLEGRRILEHEMSKTMRYKSIRELASNESGKVLKDIKPVWLMSPLSVSDSLPLDTRFFDVVIFDEASQITLEEGIPALYRAPQTIIVGDDKQMPPSNFFNAKVEDPEDLETIEGETEDEILSSDADSLLVQGARKLPSTMLSWHYRSRYETLISYSNHAFYEAGLLTVPDKTIHQQEKPLLEIGQPEEGLQTAKQLLGGSISFHYLPNSIYEARSNQGEAKYIAYMVKQLLCENIKESIGIVAFSQEQQGVIEEAISELASTDKVFEEVLEKAYNRKDEGQFTGLFVKNLENVQGDERDIIIMSVCYGHDSNKKMFMNFGPINRKGGEKRLNVIFSRAKKHMAVVSSIRSQHVTNDYNEGASYFKRFLHYAEMVSTGNMRLARIILDGLINSDRHGSETKHELSVTTTQLKKTLEANGYVVDEQIGQSSFKCSLAVKKSEKDEQYCLGILVDDDDHYRNDDLVEQYFQRPSLLQAFGWKVVNVYAKDWLEDEDKVLRMLLKQLEADSEETIAAEEPVKKDTSSAEEDTGIAFIVLHSADGSRFWQVAQEDLQLQIRFGKVGSRGLVEVKSYGSVEEAEKIKEQLLKEQLERGYKTVE